MLDGRDDLAFGGLDRTCGRLHPPAADRKEPADAASVLAIRNIAANLISLQRCRHVGMFFLGR